MHRVTKGSFGYITSQRRFMTLITVLLFAAALGIYFLALSLLGTNQNWFTILAVLLLLPGARYLASTVMFYRAKECPQEVHREVEARIGELSGAYDLYMTTEGSNTCYAIAHLAVRGKNIAALSVDPECDAKAGEAHIRKMLLANGFHGYTVKIFTDMKSYGARLAQLNRLEPDAEAERRKDGVLSLMKAISI